MGHRMNCDVLTIAHRVNTISDAGRLHEVTNSDSNYDFAMIAAG